MQNNKLFKYANPPLRGGQGGVDHELQHLIDLSGLQEKHIAEECGITPTYFSMIKTGERASDDKRTKIKAWLIGYIKNYLNFKYRKVAA